VISKRRFEKLSAQFGKRPKSLSFRKVGDLYEIEIPHSILNCFKNFDQIKIKKVGVYSEDDYTDIFFRIEILKRKRGGVYVKK